MSAGNNNNERTEKFTGSDRIDLGTFATYVHDRTTKLNTVKNYIGENRSYGIIGVVERIISKAGTSSETFAGLGSRVGIVRSAVVGVPIKCYTKGDVFFRTGGYYFIMERDGDGTDGVYQPEVTGTLLCTKTATLPSGVVATRITGGFEYIRELEDGFYSYKFNSPSYLA